MRIGMVCPYSFDVPGGVQSHVLQLAEVMRARGHDVSVLAPVSPHTALPDYVVSAGKAVAIPYNGSVARLRFGPATHRKVKKWLADGDFDVLHLHEPNAPSLSMLALNIAEGPIVATFHTSTTKSLTLSVFPVMASSTARLASSCNFETSSMLLRSVSEKLAPPVSPGYAVFPAASPMRPTFAKLFTPLIMCT